MEQKIKDFIQLHLVTFEEKTEFTDTDNIFGMGFVNSLFAMQLLEYIESEFNITIKNDDLDIINFSSVNNIVSLINMNIS